MCHIFRVTQHLYSSCCFITLLLLFAASACSLSFSCDNLADPFSTSTQHVCCLQYSTSSSCTLLAPSHRFDQFHTIQEVAACRLYQCNVCGEGGEYESLVLDCPLFTHARIVLDSWETVHQSADSFAPVGHLHPVAYHLESKRPTGTAAPHATPAAAPVCMDAPQRNLHSNNSSMVLDSQAAASSRTTEQSRSMDPNLLAVVDKALMQQTLDDMCTAAPVIEVTRQVSRSTAAAATDSGADTQSAEAARHNIPSRHSMQGRHSMQSMPAWSADVQVQCGSQYVRAICCPLPQAEGLCSIEATADALDCALAAVQQGWQLPDVLRPLACTLS